MHNLHLVSPYQSKKRFFYQNNWQRLHIDIPLLCGIVLLAAMGLVILYSATNGDMQVIQAQLTKLGIALLLMGVIAQIPPHTYRRWAPWLYAISVLLLVIVLFSGHVGKGAQRWLVIGMLRFQPSELLKLALPLMLAFFLSECTLPPNYRNLCWVFAIVIPPVLLTAKQPDLGTALLIASTGLCALLLAATHWRTLATLGGIGIVTLPALWLTMRSYQRERVLTFLNPERDPLGSGYHIIQSKIAIGSGGLFGKGWLNGTQSHLAFLPEHATDFIFAVCGEEFGLFGCLLLITIYICITLRCLYISAQAQDTFTRLLAGTLSLIFFISAFVNMGMVSGILPVVGLPLPLVSYGGSSIVTIFASFGILMSVHTHRRLIAS